MKGVVEWVQNDMLLVINARQSSFKKCPVVKIYKLLEIITTNYTISKKGFAILKLVCKIQGYNNTTETHSR